MAKMTMHVPDNLVPVAPDEQRAKIKSEFAACYNLIMLTAQIKIPSTKITDFCRRWQVVELALFGSVLRNDFTPQSDIDVLVTFAPEAEISLFDMAQMQIELQDIFGRSVDIIEKDALRNPYRKREILSCAQVVYAS